MNKNKGLRPGGFTLIELLVVVFIIGMLATLIIVNISEARKSARDAKRVANLKAIQTALEMYNQKNGEYPNRAECTNTTGGTGAWCGTCSSAGGYDTSGPNGWIKDLAPAFIPVLPTDPKPTSNGCGYFYQSNGKDYIVLAKLTMETCDGNCSTSSNTSIQEMKRPRWPNEATIAVYSADASQW